MEWEDSSSLILEIRRCCLVIYLRPTGTLKVRESNFLIEPVIWAVSYPLNDVSNVADVSQPPKLMNTKGNYKSWKSCTKVQKQAQRDAETLETSEPRNIIYLHRPTLVVKTNTALTILPDFRDSGILEIVKMI